MEELKRKRSSSEFIQARTHIWNYMLLYLDSLPLKCAVELGVPDAIHNHGSPMTLSELVQALQIPTSRTPFLKRIMRLLVNSGFFFSVKRNEEEVYDLTTSSKLLIKGCTNSLAPLVVYVSGLETVMAGQAMTAWIKGGSDDGDDENETPFHVAHGGKGWFEFASERPEFNALFNEAMVSDSKMLMRTVVEEWGDALFGGLRSLVDVGGGSGGAAAVIAGAFPGIKCSVLDLAHVVDAQPKNELVEFVEGDMFVHVPLADAVLLKYTLHGWSNEDCVKILKKCKEAIQDRGGKVIIIEAVVELHDVDSDETTITKYLLDILMMTATAGKERNENEWKTIFLQAGFPSYKIICDLGVHCVIEVYP